MFIAVHHQITDPGRFWASAQKSLPELPQQGVQRICSVFPSTDMTQAICIWEADSIDILNQYLRSKVFDWSSESYFEVNAAHSMGLHQ